MLVMALIAKHLLTINIKCLKIKKKKERTKKLIRMKFIKISVACIYEVVFRLKFKKEIKTYI